MDERIGKYLRATLSRYQPQSGKTVNRDIISNHGERLGTVAWFGRWRQYTFSPAAQTTFNRDCLLDIAKYLERINQEYRTNREIRK